ncbi:MAG TPA: hypothetical protein VG722_11215 [Tepidisphaeraceae bacterium]|nr:hypothetical protein [Tepidisphaeraceae bacterium]
MKNTDYRDRRCEPRFHPGRQPLRWHRLDAPPAKNGWLEDISFSGIQFRAESSPADAPELQERLEVRQFPGGRPMFYEVVWVGREKNNCVLGCSRIFPSPRLSKVRQRPTGGSGDPEHEPERRPIALAA